MNTPLITTSFPLFVQKLRSSAPAFAAAAESALRELLALCTSCKAKLDANAGNPDLSAEGRRKASEGFVRSALASLGSWEDANPKALAARMKTTYDAVVAAEAKPLPSDPAERLAFELRAREIRDSLRSLDPTSRLVLYYDATDPEVISALELAPPLAQVLRAGEAPTWSAFIDEEQVRSAKIERVARFNPEAAAECEALEAVHSVYQSALDTARQEFLEAVPSLRPDPIRDLLGGSTGHHADR